MNRSCTRPQEASHCLFCLTPVEKDNDEQNVDNNQHLIACCKKLLKDKIRGSYNKWLALPKHSSPLCVECLKSAEKVHSVNKQLMKINKMLKGLIEKFTIEINERVSRLSEYPEEIKGEDIIPFKDEVDCIQEDNDIDLHGDLETTSESNCPAELRFASQIHDDLLKTSSEVKKKSRKSVLAPREDFYYDRNNDLNNYLDADSPLTESQPELFTSDGLQSRDIKHEEPVPSPVQFFSDGELAHSDGSEDDPLSLGVNSVDSAKECISNYFPRVLLHKLEFDSSGQVINPVKDSSMLGKRKSAIKAVKNLRRVLKAEGNDPSIKRKYVSRTSNISKMSKRSLQLEKEKKEKIKRECKICGRPTDIYHIHGHMLSHRGEHEKRFRCSSCGRGFNYRNLFKEHVENYHSSADKGSHMCNVCGKIWKTEFRLKNHLKSHKTHSCSKCSMSFKCRLALTRHENIHSGKVYPCSLCSKSCFSEHLLKVHKKLHHSGDGRRQFNIKKSACNKSYILSRDRSKVVHEGKRAVFECPICKKELISTEGFHLHMQCHGEKEFVCDICGSQFATKRLLGSHSRYHEQEESECKICKKVFKNKHSLRTHEIMSHEKEKNHKCELCDFRTKQKTKLNVHIRNVHEKALDYECSICGKGFSQRTNCVKHEKTHEDKTLRDTETAFNCDICDNYYVDPNCLRLHQIYFHTAYTQQTADCDKCFNKFSNALELHRHTKESQKECLSRFILRCMHCQRCFESRCDLLCHVANDHPDKELPYKCQVCSIVLSSPVILEEHLNAECGINILVEKRRKQVTKKERTEDTKESSGNSEMEKTPFICSFCGKSFAGKYNLTIHEKIHTNEMPFVCSFCGKSFAVKSHLTIHEMTHRNEKPFMCSFCGKSYPSKTNLTLHEKTHRNEKAFGCSFCSKRFIQKCNLQRHERIHTGDSPFQCSYCPKAFKQSDQLKTHIRIHTGEKPYSCTVCAKKFSDLSTLIKHRKIHAP